MKGLVKNEATVFLLERGATHYSTQIRKASAHILEGLENFHCLDFFSKTATHLRNRPTNATPVRLYFSTWYKIQFLLRKHLLSIKILEKTKISIAAFTQGVGSRTENNCIGIESNK